MVSDWDVERGHAGAHRPLEGGTAGEDISPLFPDLVVVHPHLEKVDRVKERLELDLGSSL